MTQTSLSFNKLKAFLGLPYQINDYLTITQPTILDIAEYGEDEFYSMLYIFVGNPTMFRLQLWKAGIDWNVLSDYDLFASTVTSLTKEQTEIMFGEFDFSKLKIVPIQVDNVDYNPDEEDSEKNNPKKDTFVLYDVENDYLIDEDIYNQIAFYLRNVFNIFPKTQKARDSETKNWLIEEDEMKLRNAPKDHSSILLPLISGCLNHAGFKYKKDELMNVGICEFMDSVQRLQAYDTAIALQHGLYCGMADLSKVDKSQFDYFRDISVKNTNVEPTQKEKEAFENFLKGDQIAE